MKKYIISGTRNRIKKTLIAYSEFQAWVAINVLTSEGYENITQTIKEET